MDWPALVDAIERARAQVGNGRRSGSQWACYCIVCAALRRLVADAGPPKPPR